MITSAKHRWLKDIRRLRRSKDRAPDGRERLLLEGIHLVRDALGAGLELEAILATETYLGTDEAQALLPALPYPPLAVETSLLDDLADADSPRGLLAIALRPECRLADIEVEEGPGLFVYADGLQDPGNLGALARVAEAAGADALLLGPGTCRPQHPRALRGSAGSLLRLPTVTVPGVTAVDAWLGTDAVRWLTLAPRGGLDLFDSDSASAPDLGRKLVLAVGGEGPGVGDEVALRSDLALTIPMAGRVESLNATVAAALALFELVRRRRALES